MRISFCLMWKIINKLILMASLVWYIRQFVWNKQGQSTKPNSEKNTHLIFYNSERFLKLVYNCSWTWKRINENNTIIKCTYNIWIQLPWIYLRKRDHDAVIVNNTISAFFNENLYQLSDRNTWISLFIRSPNWTVHLKVTFKFAR